MQVRRTRIAGVLVMEPEPVRDERGWFARTFDADLAREHGVRAEDFVQDSVSRSHRGVVRGLHVRTGEGEAKLVRCSRGALYDVVVDLRVGSPTYGEWEGFELSEESLRSVYIPAGCAHGFQALREPSDTSYRIDRRHDPAASLAIAHDDPDIAVAWPLPVTLLSANDRAAPPLSEVRHLLGPAPAER